MKILKIAAAVLALALFTTFARSAKAETLEQEQAQQDLRDADAVARRHRAELIKIPHVRVVTGEIDEQNEPAILVEVDDKKNVDAATRQLPSQIEGFPVEVDPRDDADDESSAEAEPQDQGAAAPMQTPFPEIDKNGVYHHSWLPAAKPDSPPD
jgi:hypothetical protein